MFKISINKLRELYVLKISINKLRELYVLKISINKLRELYIECIQAKWKWEWHGYIACRFHRYNPKHRTVSPKPYMQAEIFMLDLY